MRIAFIIALVAAVLNVQGTSDRLAIEGANVIDVTTGRVQTGMTIVIEDGRIRAIEPAAARTSPAGTRRIAATGKYVIPGLFDTHAHWFGWYERAADRVRAAGTGAGVFLANGITTIIDASGQRARDQVALDLRRSLQASGRPMPRVLISGRVDGITVAHTGARDARELAKRQIALGVDGIKIRHGLSRADVRAVVDQAHASGLLVYGHTYASRDGVYDDYTRDALDAGIDGVFHVSGIAPLPSDREPATPKGATWRRQWLTPALRWSAVDERSAVDLIARMTKRGVWLQPTLVTEEAVANPDWHKDSPDWKYSPFPREDFGLPSFEGEELAQYRAGYARMKWFVRRFHEAGGLLIAGTDGMPMHGGFGVVDEVRLLEDTGLSRLAALQAATINAAKAFRLDADTGTITAGNRADLVLLDANPLQDLRNLRRIHAVVRDGRHHDRQALDALLAAAVR